MLKLVPEIRLMVGLVASAVLIAGLYFGRDILMPLTFAFLLGFVLDPLVGKLKRWGLPRGAAVVVVMAVALMALGLTGLFLGQQVSSLSAELPTYQSNIRAKLHSASASLRAPGMFDGVLKTFDVVRTEVETGARDNAAPATKGTARAAAMRVQVEDTPPSPMRRAIDWFEAASGPLASAGIAFIFVVLVLLDRLDLRDRLLRLWGGSLQQSTDAMDEAGRRITRYLALQLVVNLSYGLPMGVGLWLIGVPGAFLWGALAALMRFVPYIGPMISSVFPIALAFAVDPGWSMLLWTISLIVALELLSNNLIEPWLYGNSTGLSAISLMVAATFWTALWGPLGLIMSTPLTVCLLVIGRHLPRLGFLDVLLGSRPAFDTPTRIYQRLLAGDVEEAIELASASVEDGNVIACYDELGVGILRMATNDHTSASTAEHRHRVLKGMETLLDAIEEQHPAAEPAGRPRVVCIGGKWEVDNLAARMLTHAMSLSGHAAAFRPAGAVSADYVAGLDLDDVHTVCISYFSPEPQVQARRFCHRLHRRWPEVRIVLALWNATPALQAEDSGDALGAAAFVTSVGEAVLRTAQLSGAALGASFAAALTPSDDEERLAALRGSGALDARAKPIFDVAAKRAADIFDVPMALVALIDEHTQDVRGAFGSLSANDPGSRFQDSRLPRELSVCGHVVAGNRTLVVPDIARDLRFAGNQLLVDQGFHFYAGAPLRDAQGYVLGTLCLLDDTPRTLSRREVRLLEAMADDLMAALHASAVAWSESCADAAPASEPSTSTSTVGQLLPKPA
ncbi:phytochrome sensor protein [Rhodoferax koreense]|uniref:Phytochrome sensor protein n=1 Tax=Rhodoferax koreensis TaxID=1842727 RepID=A0A1P8JYV9_9BURK|nr:phytochrome sensor protein [Rhodoferax koreense]